MKREKGMKKTREKEGTENLKRSYRFIHSLFLKLG